MLETELAKKPGDERTLFYLAQSYRDAGMRDEAEEKYRAYLDLSGTNVQERYIASMNLSMLTKSPVEMLELVWRAIDLLPHRAEAPFSFLRRWRAEGRPVTQQIYAVATFVKGREPRKAGVDLFVNPDVYAWGLDDELAIAAFQTGHYRESMEASLRCIPGAPTEEMRLSALRNAQTAKEKIIDLASAKR
jgi:tetratricopeptide (TPR) repeat protein